MTGATTTAPHVRLALGAALLSGVLVAVQQRINGELGVQLGDALTAAVVSFLTGLVVVAVVVAVRPGSRRALPAVRTTARWERLGGLGGASLVAAGAVAAPEIGVALFSVGLVAGQVGGSLAGDRVGLGPGGPRPLTAPRLLGASLCLVAVLVAGLGRSGGTVSPLLIVAVVVAGGLVAVQQALNGRVRLATGDAGVATLVSFVVGSAALLVGLAVHVLVSGLSIDSWPGPDQWYLYAGGPVGASFVAVAAVAVAGLGVLRLGLAVIAGQLFGAVLLDAFVPAAGTSLAVATVVGAALTLVAVLVSGLRPR